MKEQWKDIKGFKGIYQISNFGRVKSLSREVIITKKSKFGKNMVQRFVKPERILGEYCNRHGYPVAALWYPRPIRKCKTVTIHRLVATHFVPNPKKLSQVNHIDNNHNNNHVSNLEWVTPKQNMEHAVEIGALKNRQNGQVLTQEMADEIRTKHATGKYGQFALADEYGVTQAHISNIITGRCWVTHSPNDVMTKATARKIRKRYAKGNITQEALAHEYNTSQESVSQIVNNKIWK